MSEMPDAITPEDLFSCTKCGDCCKGFGGTYVTDADIRAIAAFIGISPERFKTQYCQDSGKKKVIAQGENGYCVFWDQICTIHPVKPRMCRAWPFIESLKVDINNWYIMAGSCPGICTDYPEHAIKSSILRILDK